MSRPNIVFILADDMGYGDFSAFNEGRTHTPAIDSLVSDGICLTHHYAAAPACTPARAALLTGRYHHRTGAIDMRELMGLSRLSLKETTIADVFKANGYATGLVGKWHNGAIGQKYHPNARGFDEFVGFRGGECNYYNWCLYYNDEIRRSDGRYVTDVFTDASVDFIKRHKDSPFFLHVAYNAPHTPLQAPDEDVKPFIEQGRYTKAVSILYGMIKRMDKGIEKILNELKLQGIDDNTLVLFSSDNGPVFDGEGDMCLERYNNNLRGTKFHVYEGGIRVPAVVKWPARLAKGVIKDEFVHATDWFPTMLAAAGIEVPKSLKLDGQNILPILQGETVDMKPKRFWQWNRYKPLMECNAAMRDGEWKLVRPPIKEAFKVMPEDYAIDRKVEAKPEEFNEIVPKPFPERTLSPPETLKLYNILKDPYEQDDLSSLHPERVKKMNMELEAWFKEVESERAKITE